MFNNITLSNLQLSAIRELIRAELDRNYEIKENASGRGYINVGAPGDALRQVLSDSNARINELESLLIAINCAVAV